MEQYQQKIVLKRTGSSLFEIEDSEEYLNRRHMCETCGKRFTLLENLNRHQMIHTDERPFPCSFCKKRFRLAQHLKEHVRIHTGEKPYKCPTCGRAFCQISNLKSHQKTHTKIKAFKCDICGKCFRRSFTMKQHKLTHTRRSYSGAIGRMNADMPSPKLPPLSRHMSAPVPTVVHTDVSAGSRAVVRDIRKESLSSFCSDLLRPNGAVVHPSSAPAAFVRPTSRPSGTPARPLSGCFAPFVKPEMSSREPSPIGDFPSLSALLQCNADGPGPKVCPERDSRYPPEMLRYFHQMNAPKIQPLPEFPKMCDFAGVQTQNDTNISEAMNTGSTDGFTCVHCNEKFPHNDSLRDHVMRHHSRKGQRRDSAYSSHSDKSVASSPNATKMAELASSTSSSDVKEVTSHGVQQIEVVEEPEGRRFATDVSATSQQGSMHEAAVPQDVECPDVGHSPTETSDREESRESSGEDKKISRPNNERKFVKRAADGQQKWKRQLCQEWYEVPVNNNGDSEQIQSRDREAMKRDQEKILDNDRHENNIKQVGGGFQVAAGADVSPHELTADSNVQPRPAQLPETGAFDIRRFAPIVAWKPVVTGWKDLVCGTLYAVPPQFQQDYLSVQAPLYDYRLVQPHARSGDGIAKPDANGVSSSGAVAQVASPHYFRFSPRTVEKFALNSDGQSPLTPESGVYTGYYPTETLPIPGYSRIQHGLLYQWDPNRIRLGGTSTVPNTADPIPAT